MKKKHNYKEPNAKEKEQPSKPSTSPSREEHEKKWKKGGGCGC